ncbi:MAG: glycosyltransferase [bacterium]|nr:glycosyltransferase [bacterium]
MASPLLILFIHLGLGGVQRKIVDIVNYLALGKPDLPIVILLRNKEEFELISEVQNKKVKIINYQALRPLKIPFFFPFFIIYQIYRLNPRSVLAFLDFVSLPAIWAKMIFFWRPTRLVLSEDHYASKIIPTFALGRLRNLLVKIFYPFADAVFTCSQATRQDLIKNYGIKPEKVKIIVNWTTFANREVGVKRKKYDLIYIGRLVQTKNLEFLLKAIKNFKEKGRELTLCLMGSGQDKENLENLAVEYNIDKNVIFLEPKNDVENYLAQAKVFVYCSQLKAEGYPMAILEAMAVGVPVLSRNFAGADEFLEDGENCYIFKNEKEYGVKLFQLLDDSRNANRIALSAKKYVIKYHSPENIDSYLKELQLS